MPNIDRIKYPKSGELNSLKEHTIDPKISKMPKSIEFNSRDQENKFIGILVNIYDVCI